MQQKRRVSGSSAALKRVTLIGTNQVVSMTMEEAKAGLASPWFLPADLLARGDD